MVPFIPVRERPFNFKGGRAGYGFFGKICLKKVSEMGRQKYSVRTLCLKNYCFYRQKIMSRQLVMKTKFCCAAKQKKIF